MFQYAVQGVSFTFTLLVRVLAIGYFAMNKEGTSTTSTVVIDKVDDVGTDFKLDIGKNGGVSGSIEKK